jgi:two-component system, cell cycle response regulator
MSLRVLLADESDTIKKVFQLALQDLNAEVKSVHSGLDVLDVATSFKPSIIFADILLQKRNGYEICLEIKHSAALKDVPVVLMWSSFMELDQEQFKKCFASDQLEKPFDADHLRDIVRKHTPVIDTNPMAQFLNFPKNIVTEAAPHAPKEPSLNFTDRKAAPPLVDTQSPPIPLDESELNEDTSEFNMGALLESETPAESKMETAAMTAAPPQKKSLFDDLAIEAAPASNQEAWATKDLSQFKLTEDKSDDLDKFEALNLSTPTPPAPEEDDEPTAELGESMQQFHIEQTEEPLVSRPSHSTSSRTLTPPEPKTHTSTKTINRKVTTLEGLNDSEIEAIVRAHTEEVIKNQIQDSLLFVVEKIVREELNKIMEEELRLNQDYDGDN